MLDSESLALLRYVEANGQCKISDLRTQFPDMQLRIVIKNLKENGYARSVANTLDMADYIVTVLPAGKAVMEKLDADAITSVNAQKTAKRAEIRATIALIVSIVALTVSLLASLKSLVGNIEWLLQLIGLIP